MRYERQNCKVSQKTLTTVVSVLVEVGVILGPNRCVKTVKYLKNAYDCRKRFGCVWSHAEAQHKCENCNVSQKTLTTVVSVLALF